MRRIPKACVIFFFFLALSCVSSSKAPEGGTADDAVPELSDQSQYHRAEQEAARKVDAGGTGALPEPEIESAAMVALAGQTRDARQSTPMEDIASAQQPDENPQADIPGLTAEPENVPVMGLMLPAAPVSSSTETAADDEPSMTADVLEPNPAAETTPAGVGQPDAQPATAAPIGTAAVAVAPPYADNRPLILSSRSPGATPPVTSSPSAVPAVPSLPIVPVDSTPQTANPSPPAESNAPIVSSPLAPVDAHRPVSASAPAAPSTTAPVSPAMTGKPLEPTPAPQKPAAVPAPQAKTAASPPQSSPSTGAGPQATTSQTGESQSRVREIYARVGDEVEIGLDGQGFVFLGFPDKSQSDGMSFKSKEVRNGKTYFKFKAFARGSYELVFLQQDNATGKTSRESVRIHVVSDEDFAGAVNLQDAASASPAAAPQASDAGYAEKLAAMGKYQEALTEYLQGYREGDSSTNDKIAGLYFQTGDYDAAEKYYKKNLASAAPYTESAVLGLVRIAMQRKDSAAFLSYLKPFLAIKTLDIGNDLLNAARFQKERGEIGVGLELLGQYTGRYPQGRGIDEAEYLTAQLREADSPFRDIQQARDIYGKILQSLPESPYANPSRERLRYIEQHFFFIR